MRDVETVDPPPGFLPGPATRIGIFMSVTNVHVNRMPADGTVRWISYHPGTFRDARSPQALKHNEHNFVGLELDDGRKVLVNQIAGAVARRIVCAAAVGDRFRRGQRFGMVKFGSRVELYLPEADQYDILAKPGDKVRAGLSVLAVSTPRVTS